MQSIKRALKRKNAIAFYNSEITGCRICYLKGSTVEQIRNAKKYDITNEYLKAITKN